ncbi:MAG TPA: SusC/RagA family TonB-linked outer membrane protein [Flavisolibacter sp.]|nr:SusC/RagA family TonB-linked outer membrane protein [Flavisolibacter sp.]
MKLLLLLTAIACLQSSAKGFAQNITINFTGAPLEEVFKELKQKTGYSFVYTRAQLVGTLPVTCKAKDVVLKEALNLCFRNQPLSFVIEDRYIIVQTKTATTQSLARQPVGIGISGRVINENGEGVAGATIAVKNSNNATSTDNRGEFSLKDVDEEAVLLITSVGFYSEEVPVNRQTNFLVRLRIAVSRLDETIIIGYGKTTRRYSTETVAKVQAEEIGRQPISNPLSALTGRVSGLQVIQSSGVPGASIRVLLRGRNSIANGNDPLYIVDGVPFPSATLNDIFAGGGGISSSPLDNLNPANIKSIEVLKDASATAIYGSRGANGVILITTKKGEQGRPQVTLKAYTGLGRVTRRLDLLNTPQYLSMRREAFSNDGVTPNISNAPDLLLWDTTRYTDWQKVLIGNTMHTNDVNISLTGGTAQTQFLLSSGYHRETTVFPGSFSAEKVSGQMNINHHSANQKFSISMSSSFLQNKTTLPREDLSNFIRLAPNTPSIYQTDGKLNWQQSTWNNPYGKIMQLFETDAETFNGNFQMGYRITSVLEIRLTGGYTSLSHQEHYIQPAKSQDPAFAPIARAGFGKKNVRTTIAEPQISYSIALNTKHKIDFLAGGSFQQNLQTSLHQTGSGYSSDDLLYSLSAAATIVNSSESDIRYRYAAMFGRVNYSFNNKYLFTATVRRDGSSRYAPNSRFAGFGSIGAGWVFTKEKFLSGSRLFSFGKLKLSAGVTGNDQIGDYKYLDLYRSYTYSYFSAPTFTPVQLFSPSYTWERVVKLEGGIDVALWNERVNVAVNYYRNKTGNQLVNYSLPGTTGFASILRNLPATILNTGLEIEIYGEIKRTQHWKWTASLNLTIPKNKLMAFENFASSSYANVYEIGQPLFIAKTYGFAGVNPSNGIYTFTDYNNNGQITSVVDQKSIVNTSQQFFGGLNQTINYKRLTANIHFQFTGQQNALNYIYLFSRPGSVSNQPKFVLNRWQKPGDNTDIQRYSVSGSQTTTAYSNLQFSDAAYSNASFVRLRNLHISYSLIQPNTNAKGITNCKLYIQGQNLLTFTRYKGLDPETQTLLPPIKVLTVGFQVNF